MTLWLDACATDDIELEDVWQFDHNDRVYAIYRSPDDSFFCTDGLCTHEDANLTEGLVIDYIIECPMHNGQFDYRSGEALRTPVCEALETYPVRVENDRILVAID